MSSSKFFEEEFTAQAASGTTYWAGIEIEIASSGDGLRYRWVNGEEADEPIETEIEHKDNEETGEQEAGFYIGDTFHNLQNFIKLWQG